VIVLGAPALVGVTVSQLSELAADYQDEQSASTHTAELLETETAERIRLEKEVKDLQVSLNDVAHMPFVLHRSNVTLVAIYSH